MTREREKFVIFFRSCIIEGEKMMSKENVNDFISFF